MRTFAIAVLLLSASWAQAQSSCPLWNSSGVFQQDYAQDVNGHTTGNHNMATSNGNWTCTYSGGPGTCNTLAQVGIPSPTVAESGHLSGLGACHAHNVATTSPQASGQGAETANGEAVGAVVNCIACACNISISLSPVVSVSPNPVWTHTAPMSHTCPAETGIATQQCTGNPTFTCSEGQSPTCVDGQWSCNGSAQCSLDGPFPTDCTEGQSVQCTSGGWQCVGNPGTPIVIDTDGKGFHLSSAAAGVSFDLSGDGKPEQISWTAQGSTNGWLALPAEDGTVTSGKQLFGNFTPQPASNNPNGFLALAVYDQPDHGGNGDGVIDWRDTIWPSLRVWIDSNHDGVAQATELHTLPSLGITSLAYKYTETKFTDQYGNIFRYKGRANPEGQPKADAVDRVIYDVFLVRFVPPGVTNNSMLELLKERLQ